MKYSGKCIKCDSPNIVVERKKNMQPYTNYIYVKKNWASYISLSRFICLHCGYTEEWIEDPEDLAKIEKKYRKDENYDGFV